MLGGINVAVDMAKENHVASFSSGMTDEIGIGSSVYFAVAMNDQDAVSVYIEAVFAGEFTRYVTVSGDGKDIPHCQGISAGIAAMDVIVHTGVLFYSLFNEVVAAMGV